MQFNDIKNVHNWNYYKEPKEIEKDLKPCPFCGSEKIDLHLPLQMVHWSFWGIGCTECGANFERRANTNDPDDPEWERARIEIVDLWNRRMK